MSSEVKSLYLTSVVPSATRLVSVEAGGAPFTSQYSVLRIFKAIATRIRGKSKQTLKSSRIELGTPCFESRALAELRSLRYACKSLVFKERGKPEYPRKNLSEQGREPTNSTHIWRRIRESIPGHIGGRRLLSPLGQPCSPAMSMPC